MVAVSAEVRARILVLRRALCRLEKCLSEVAATGTPGAVNIVESLLDQGEPELRRSVGAAIDQYERAVSHFRSAVVRVLVDHAGCTLTTTARRLGVSRSMATRLYKLLEPEGGGVASRLRDG